MLGEQLATTRILPPGVANDTAVSLAEAVGMGLDPWQSEILIESNRRDHSGHRTARQVVALVPRQNGKSYLVCARILAGALLYDDALTLYSAHEYRTAREVWAVLEGICHSDYMQPLIWDYPRGIKTRGGFEEITFHNGARAKLIARTRRSTRGMSPDCIIFDEAFSVSDEVVNAAIPSMSARPDPQVWYLSSAGTWESFVLMRLRARGHEPATAGMAYWEWHGSPDDNIHDQAVWARCNPGYGRRLTEASIRLELGTLSTRAFQRERLGIWQESTVDSVLRDEEIEALTVDVPRPPTGGEPIGWGVDVAWDRSSAAIAAAFRLDGVLTVTAVDVRPGASWALERLAQLDQLYGIDGLAFDTRGGLADLMDRAERDYEIALQPLRANEYPAACAALVQRVTERSVHFGRAPALLADAGSAVSKSLTGGWVWDRKTASPPTALIAATCALYALEHGEGGAAVGVF